MIRVKDIVTALSSVVGWSTEEGYEQTDLSLDSDLVLSESGLFFQQVHPLLTLRNIAALAPETINAMPKGDEKNKAFSSWLRAKTNASISKAILQYCNNKAVDNMSKALLENKVLFDGTSKITDTIKNTESLVGFEIVPIRAKGVTVKINKIGLQFTQPGDYKLYLIRSGLETPVKVIDLKKATKNSLEWFNQEDLFLPYISESGDAGGSWYLVYSQAELPEGSQAINKEYDWSKGPCTWCSRRQLELYKAWSKYIEIHPFKTSIPDSDILLWDVSSNLYTYTTNYGLNLEISIACDITDFIVEQRLLFKDIIWYQVGSDMLRELAYNPNARTNRFILNASRAEILYELDGDSRSTKQSGLVSKLEKAYKAVDLNTRNIDRVCLTCKGTGVKYRSAVI